MRLRARRVVLRGGQLRRRLRQVLTLCGRVTCGGDDAGVSFGCFNLSTDRANCGLCGHACPGWTSSSWAGRPAAPRERQRAVTTTGKIIGTSPKSRPTMRVAPPTRPRTTACPSGSTVTVAIAGPSPEDLRLTRERERLLLAHANLQGRGCAPAVTARERAPPAKREGRLGASSSCPVPYRTGRRGHLTGTPAARTRSSPGRTRAVWHSTPAHGCPSAFRIVQRPPAQ